MTRPLAVALLIAVTLPVTAAAQPPANDTQPPPARENRLALTLSIGGGWTDLSGLDALARDVRTRAEGSGLTFSGTPSNHHHVAASLSLRYYAPYHLMAQVGYGALYNWASVDVRSGSRNVGSVENHNLIMEVPILVGGYYPVHDRINLYGAVGPSFFFFAKSYWDASPGGLPDFESDSGIGMRALAGAEYFLADHLALGLELHYRLLRAGKMREQDTNTVVTSGQIRGDGSSETYDLDFSSVSAMLNVRMYLM